MRLIDADALKDFLRMHLGRELDHEERTLLMAAVLPCIDAQPTIEPER